MNLNELRLQAISELKEEYKDNPIALKKLKKYEAKINDTRRNS